ncbi:MAG: NERD domain-containing protein [Oscillospiraceae bacterium]|nr:NERD domain-containing protein [Oscillospiraceae bacterium]
MQIYRNKNPYYRKLFFISVTRIVLIVLPFFVLAFLFWRLRLEHYLEIAGFAVLIAGIAIAYAALTRHYKILLSGHNGERALFKIIKHLRCGEKSAVFINLPIAHKGNRSEIDMLLIGECGVVIIEVKNHSGVITGGEGDDFWVQRKSFREGKSVEKKMLNPFMQLKRQRGIIKNILRENGADVWVENLLFFSNPNVKLRIDMHRKNNRAFSSKDKLLNYINNLTPHEPLSERTCEKIIGVVRKLGR